MLKEDKYSIKTYENQVDIDIKVDHYKIVIILLSNMALVHYKLDSYFKSRMFAKMGINYIREIREIINKEKEENSDPELEGMFEKKFADLAKKLKFRLS